MSPCGQHFRYILLVGAIGAFLALAQQTPAPPQDFKAEAMSQRAEGYNLEGETMGRKEGENGERLEQDLSSIATHVEVPAKGHAVIHILSANEDGEAVGEAVTSPLIAFRVENGHVDGAAILECEQETETRKESDVSYHVIALTCGDTKLAVVGLDLTVKK